MNRKIDTPKVDLHSHTIASDHADGTWREMAEAAQEKGLEAFAVTEHGPSIYRCPHVAYFENLPLIAPKDLPLPMLYGIEDDLIDNCGHTALPDQVKEKLDIVLLGTHCFGWARTALLKDIQLGLMKAMENPNVDIVSHPVNPWYPLDLREIVKQSCATGTCLEFNLSKLDFQEKNWRDFLALAAEYRCPMVIGSDAHKASELGFHKLPYEWLETAGVNEEQIKNRDLRTAAEYFHFTRPDVMAAIEKNNREK